jgi:hypothetical protein
MVIESVVLCERLPLVPVIATVYDACLFSRDALSVSVDFVVVAGFGENVLVSPAGVDVAARSTGEANPFSGVIVTVYVVVLLPEIRRDDGVTLIAKSDTATG